MNVTILLALMTLVAVRSDPDQPCLLGSADRAVTLSTSCLSCHDGSTAPAVGFHGNVRGSHPVSVAYAAADRPELSLRAVGPRSTLVVLPAGRVECTTCHTASGSGPHRTVLATGALCTGCHEK